MTEIINGTFLTTTLIEGGLNEFFLKVDLKNCSFLKDGSEWYICVNKPSLRRVLSINIFTGRVIFISSFMLPILQLNRLFALLEIKDAIIKIRECYYLEELGR